MPGADLEVERRHDCFRVAGFNPQIALAEHPELHSWDLFAQYLKTPRNWSAGRSSKADPHLLFANADSEEKLIAFLKKFGPVVAKSVEEQFGIDPGNDVPPIRTGEQDIGELRSERLLYHSALVLLAELDRGTAAALATFRACISEIVDKVSDWPRQWKREQQLRSLKNEPTVGWEFNEAALRRMERFQAWAEDLHPTFGDRIAGGEINRIARVMRAGRDVICELVNAFKPWVYVVNNRVFELPHWDLSYGIRPLLYHILRQQYVQSGGIGVCANDLCRELFKIDRAGQRFCKSECSRRQRQREYWAEQGKKLRGKRLKRKKVAKYLGRKGR
jgi:hypothetical protein